MTVLSGLRWLEVSVWRLLQGKKRLVLARRRAGLALSHSVSGRRTHVHSSFTLEIHNGALKPS